MEGLSIEITSYGKAELLSVKEKSIDDSLEEKDVLIDVHYSGINFADIVMRLGMYQDAPPKPFVPGYEISGIVRAVGKGVKRFKVGDKVMAGTRFGGYSSVVKLPDWQVLPLPENFSLAEGAATPVNYITAHIALHEFGRIRKGDRVLIDCATGGVGVFCLQMCQAAGAETIGLTSSESKKSFIEGYGARAMTHEEFWSSSEKDFNFILNSTGGKSLKGFYDRLTKSGLLLCIGLQQAINQGKSTPFSIVKALVQSPWYPILKLMMGSKSVGGFNALKFFDDEEWMKKLLVNIEQSQIKPHIDKSFSSKDVASAHQYLESKKAKGKVLISWRE